MSKGKSDIYTMLHIYITILDWTDLRVSRSLRSLANTTSIIPATPSIFVLCSVSMDVLIGIITQHAQRERGKVIGCGVHISESTVVLSM